jgi:hypothetical protein
VHLGSSSRTILRLGTATVALAALAGCGLGHDDPRAGATAPATAGECDDLPHVGGDPGIVRGSHWASDHHSWGDRVTVYACEQTGEHGWVSLVPTTAVVVVAPARQRLEAHATGIYPFSVAVGRGASGPLTVRLALPNGKSRSTGEGPVIEPDGDGWHFVAVPS